MQSEEKEWSAFYADYVKTYMERDVRELAAVHDLNVFLQFMIAAATRTGEILNYSTIASEIGKDVATVKKWFSIFRSLRNYLFIGAVHFQCFEKGNQIAKVLVQGYRISLLSYEMAVTGEFGLWGNEPACI